MASQRSLAAPALFPNELEMGDSARVEDKAGHLGVAVALEGEDAVIAVVKHLVEFRGERMRPLKADLEFQRAIDHFEVVLDVELFAVVGADVLLEPGIVQSSGFEPFVGS